MSTIVIKDGNLWGCGYNHEGQLGLGVDNIENQSTFKLIPSPNGVKFKFVDNHKHTIAISENGELWVCGENQSGQLGLGNFENKYELTRVVIPDYENTKFIFATVGISQTALIDESGNLWFAGEIPHCPFKSPDASFQPRFVCLSEKLNCKFDKVGVSRLQLMTIDKNGRVWVYNTQTNGLRLVKLDDVSSKFTLMAHEDRFSFYDDKGYFWGCSSVGTLNRNFEVNYREDLLNYKYTRKLRMFNIPITAMYNESSGYTIVKDVNGEYWYYMGSGQGIKPIETFCKNPITQIKCNSGNTIQLDSDGNVYVNGNNQYGQCGLGFKSNSIWDEIKHPTLVPFRADKLAGVV